MKADILSASGIKLYMECPAAYKHRYEKKTPERPGKRGNYVGNLFHEAIELFVNHRYARPWKTCVYEAAKDASTKGFGTLLTFSPEEISTSVQIGEEWLNYPLPGREYPYPLPPADRIHGTEVSFGPPGDKLAIEGNGVKFDSGLRVRGLIDLLWIDEGPTVVVGDYKTSQTLMETKNMSNDIQAMIYALVAHQFVPDLPIRVEFYFPRYPENGPVIWHPDRSWEDIEQMLWMYQQRIRSDKDGTPMPGDSCRLCDYQHACPKFKEWTAKMPPRADTTTMLSMMDDVEVFNFVDKLQDQYGAFAGLVKDAKKELWKRFDANNLRSVGQWEITRRSRTEYRPEAALLVAELNREYGSPSKWSSVEKQRLKAYAIVKWESPFIWRNYRKKTTEDPMVILHGREQ